MGADKTGGKWHDGQMAGTVRPEAWQGWGQTTEGQGLERTGPLNPDRHVDGSTQQLQGHE